MVQEMTAENDLINTLPSERPLLRQPLGFSIDQPVQSINTYQAFVSAPIKSGVFLPGQEVPASSKLKKLKGKKKSTVAKRPRQPEAYAKQTSRFRLQTYDPSPNVEPLTDYGGGPYAPVYRGIAPAPETRPHLRSTAATTSLQGRPSSSTASSNTKDSFRHYSSLRSLRENSSAPKSEAAAGSKGKNTQPVAASLFSCSRFQQFTNENIGSTALGGPYYRRNYESQHEHATSLPPSQRQSAQSETQKNWGQIARSQTTSSRGTDNEEAEGLELKSLWLCFLYIYRFSRPVTKAFTHSHYPHPGYS